MIQPIRSIFNSHFSPETYRDFLDSVEKDFNHKPTFRIAESPFFIPKDFQSQLEEACDQVIDFIKRPDFKAITQKALDLNTSVPNEDAHTQFLAIDFGVCEENEKLIPKLIEVQGFPSIFNFQFNLNRKFKEAYPFLEDYTPYLSGLDESSYLEKLKEVILGDYSPEEVILLEIEPEKQNTKIDFYYCQRDLGVRFVCVTAIKKEGKKLFYTDADGKRIQIKRIYNRVIFDELDARPDLDMAFSFQDDLEVEWAGHPNWYTRISKFILPYLSGPYFIETTLLSDLESIPEDLENYVLKPLFSFSGAGVIFNVTREGIEKVEEKDLFILQKKVNYQPVIQAIDGRVKVEVRILALWPEKDEKPTLVGNLCRLSRGEMIGVKFNKDKDWVGGSIGLFEK
ncbi:hypothetical protein [Algoriphagus zhangzhouensis]|uniref:Glutathionylspermidine synthase preATP-grasp n=1 Tax=Algoriphagus zhangzhouensis TaxID=1073327 RepID=A0A1M7ZCM7_9BACT|nr:hypothetical protein [Algoriphagus zhangzhouensis]TDY45631.1 hypothetical protein A8938_2231 [Algoriphagus zhangzhouensis]SHO62665.1 hypothetical protein SAMN04488108_2229 [Algoriphagus zhangzhouensis]